MSSAAPAKLRSGNASRNAVMNAFTSARPRRGACNEYCKRMSAVHSSSTIEGFQVLPQNSVNHRLTMALLSCSFDMMNSFARLRLLDRARGRRHRRGPGNEWRRDEITVLEISLHSASCCRNQQREYAEINVVVAEWIIRRGPSHRAPVSAAATRSVSPGVDCTARIRRVSS